MLTPRKLLLSGSGNLGSPGIKTEELTGVDVLNIINVNVKYMGNGSEHPIGVIGLSGGHLNCRYIETDVGAYSIMVGSWSNTPDITVHSCVYRALDNIRYFALGSANFLVDDTSLWNGVLEDKPNEGPDAYPMNSTPIPTNNRITVGEGKDYATVREAYNAANDGDNIVIDAGTHAVTDMMAHASNSIVGLWMTKNIRFYGATQNAADVILSFSALNGYNGFTFWLRNMTTAIGAPAPGMFHLTLDGYNIGGRYSWRSSVMARTDAG